ncbi:MAG: hypothetical protein M1837_007466 [Sclerophora amabilis]|nr:MAG: hypothetical protein M1837_007466 [Sclerophora amabilis]
MAEFPQSSSMSAPYRPTTSSLGGIPNVNVDIPITAVFLALFIVGAATHMAIFQKNKRRGHKFLMSGILFGFCMSRILSCVLRIAWATRPTNISLAIAAQIFVAAGVVLLFIINIIFAQRITRAAHPHFGWHRAASIALRVYYGTIVASLFMLITVVVQSFYTLNPNTKRIDRDIQIYGSTYFAVAAFIPIVVVILALIVPRRTRVEKFGVGRFRTKVVILLLAATVLTLGAAFRAGTLWLTPRPLNNPAWYQSKACFYIFDFTVEIIVLYLYAIVRVDTRFHIPNGSKGPGDYTAGKKEGGMIMSVRSEEEVFDDMPSSRGTDDPDKEESKEDQKLDEEAGLGATPHRP